MVFTEEVIENRRSRVEAALGSDAPLVLVAAGESLGKPGGHDQVYPFIPHPEYYWLTGSRRRRGVIAFDPADGWSHFVQPVTEDERLWEGEPEVPEGEDVAQLPAWLESRSDRKMVVLGQPVEILWDLSRDDELAAATQASLDAVRRVKDAAELDLVRRAARATAAGHEKAREFICAGVTERRIQIELEAEMYRNGATGMGFDTIVGTGTNAAVLHFAPGGRQVQETDLVLVDAGGEVLGYTADVTRTYPASGVFTPEQQAIYDLVLAAEHQAISLCKPGVEWHDVHRAAALVLALGLRDLGLLTGEVDGLLESGAVALFFPHGIGHMLGLGVRDVGGCAQGRQEDQRYCGARLRVDMPLEEGFLMTVEPGLYFVPAMLDSPERRRQFANQIHWDHLARWRQVGGVRIEDDVLVTSDDPEIITSSIPK